MKSYTIYKPDYEHPPEIFTFEKKELAIEFIRKFFPKSKIEDIDKPYITYHTVNNSKELTEDDIESNFTSDFFIVEKELLTYMPEVYLLLFVFFDTYDTDKWKKRYEVLFEKPDYNLNYSETLRISKLVILKEGDNKEEILDSFYNSVIDDSNKDFKTVLSLESGSIINYLDTLKIKDKFKSLNDDMEYTVEEYGAHPKNTETSTVSKITDKFITSYSKENKSFENIYQFSNDFE